MANELVCTHEMCLCQLKQALDYDVKKWMTSQACIQATAIEEDAEALIKALEALLFKITTLG